MMNGLIQPQAIDLEEIVLGAILLESNALEEILELLTEDSFYKHEHQIVFKAILDLNKSNTNIDLLTVVDQLKKNNDLERCGGSFFIGKLTNRVAGSANILTHAKIIKEKELRRKAIIIATSLSNNSYDDTEDIFDTLVKFSLECSKLISIGESKQIRKLNEVIIENHQLRTIPKIGVKSKFNHLPDYESGKLYIIAGRPGMGKTTFTINESYHYSKSNVVLFFSLEMSANEIVTKIESLESRIESFRLNKNRIHRDEEQKYNGLTLLDTNFYIDDTPAIDLQHIKTKANKLKNKHGLGMIVIDYLQLMKGDKNGNREQEISSITRGLKEISKSFGVPVIALSQLSRAVESRANKRPQLSDLRESGSIEQDADVVSFLYRPYYYAEQSGDEELKRITPENLVEYIIAKNRGGSLGIKELSCNLAISEFTNKEEFKITEETPF